MYNFAFTDIEGHIPLYRNKLKLAQIPVVN